MNIRWAKLTGVWLLYTIAVYVLIKYQHSMGFTRTLALGVVGIGSFYVLHQLLKIASKASPLYSRMEWIAARILLAVMCLGTLLYFVFNVRSLYNTFWPF